MASNAASVAASLAEAGHLSKTSNNSKISSSLLVLAATAVILVLGEAALRGLDARGGASRSEALLARSWATQGSAVQA